jgi:outer membrane receptor protein involved in Fe transport
VNANNLFNVTALTETQQGEIPPTGVVIGRTMNGRTISASIRFTF